jgi:hypothetical protein
MQSKKLSISKNKRRLTSDEPTKSMILRVRYINENLFNDFENTEDDED